MAVAVLNMAYNVGYVISVAIDCVNFSHTDKTNKYAQWLNMTP